MNKKDIRAYWGLSHNLRSNLPASSLPSQEQVLSNIMQTLNLPQFPEGGSILDDDVKVKVKNVLIEEAIKAAYSFGLTVGRYMEKEDID